VTLVAHGSRAFELVHCLLTRTTLRPNSQPLISHNHPTPTTLAVVEITATSPGNRLVLLK
jgi:hypothetical protein